MSEKDYPVAINDAPKIVEETEHDEKAITSSKVDKSPTDAGATP